MFHKICLAVLCCVLLPAPLLVSAQSYPSKPVRIIVPFSAGSASDIVARIIGQRLAEDLGQPVIVDNKPGAIGTLGASLAAKAPPDGYTISLGASGTHGSSVSLFNKLPYDPVKDFAPITLIGYIPFALVCGNDLPEDSLQELVTSVKANPGKRTLGAASGVSRLFGELFKMTAAADMAIVPYKSVSPAFIDLISGRLDCMFETVPASLPQIKAGRLKALVVTSSKRSALLPNIPTIAESGYPGFEANVWTGFFAPAGTPKEIIAKLNTVIVRVLQLQEIREKMMENGTEAAVSTPEQLGNMVKLEVAKWARVVEKANLPKVD